MNEILDLWAGKSHDTQSLKATFTREDFDETWESTNRFNGTAFVKRPNLAYLNFEKVVNGKAVPSERIISTGPEIYQFLTETKQVHVYPLPAEEQKRAVEEGPLPFLFNMEAAKIRARYQIRLVNENKELYLIAIKPLQAEDRDAFSLAYIWLDRAKLQPTKIQLHDPANFKNTKTYVFRDIQVNAEIKDVFFDAKTQWQGVRSQGWDLVMHGPDGKPVTPRTTVPLRPAQGPTTTPKRERFWTAVPPSADLVG